MTPLCDLCIKYGTDKGPREMNGWGYSPFYYERFKDERRKVERVLEIGICGFRDIPNNVVGASLYVWREFFTTASIYGIDNDRRFIFNNQHRISTTLADAYDSASLRRAIQYFNVENFDFIVDDAVHDPEPQLKLLHDLWKFLKVGGVYAMEDVCPYKVENGDLNNMIVKFPKDSYTQIIETHKAERLLLIEKR